ncbi:MAG: stage II sporulation protein R [Clostridia bacterium]|nr:stage II sporulation protein R [Clostridia bacterium]
MKKALVFAILTTMFVIIVCAWLKTDSKTYKINQNDVLRIHIRANSNSQDDQSIKYKVKSMVVEYLTPLLINATTKQNAIKIIENNLEQISLIATQVLVDNHYNYSASASLSKEYFPTRSYGDVTIYDGVYDALIINLGSANGDNWWCLVYPPLCFVSNCDAINGNIIYKSKLMEIIQKFFNK